MQKSEISWCGYTWNPVTGCTKVSAGCKNCYAERVANRFWGDRKFTDVHVHPEKLGDPLKRKKPSLIFVNSMSDLFYEKVSGSFIERVFNVMNDCPQHIFLILTKRPGWAENFFDVPLAPTLKKNIWLGVSVEDQKTADERIPELLKLPTKNLFVSAEPLLGEVYLDKWLNRIKWVIVGGESGPDARPMHPAWVRSIMGECDAYNVPFFFKQWGEWREPIPDVEEFDTSKGRDGKPPAFLLDLEGRVHCFHDPKNPDDSSVAVVRVGKTKAGHLLDVREYSEVPGAIARVSA